MSIDLIPLEYYTGFYHHVILLVTLVVFYDLVNKGINRTRVGLILLLFVIIYMGLRPISGRYFGDMGTYARYFEQYQAGNPILVTNDLLFHYFMQWCSRVMSANVFFLTCAALYIVPMYVISKKWFKEYWLYAFLMLVGSFSFWAYGTNGIRNGVASSFFLLAIASSSRVWQLIWMGIAVSFHMTLALPAVGFVITWFYNKPRSFFYFWLLCIPLSLALPGFWEGFFGSMIGDDRAAYFTDDTYADSFSSTGFRWDFLLYSALGVGAGWYYIVKRKLRDVLYFQLFNVFLFANAFWVLVIRASFSNRFAYLSWFMMALVIIYPWLKYYFEKKQSIKLGWIILAYFGFTYFMNVFVYG